ncbi:MAG: hypothetical protein ACOY4R_25950 [Pseudomonadota bacterium]
MVQWTQIAIAAGFAMVVAVAIQLFRARAARRRTPTHVHGALMKRAGHFADRSPFLRNVCREFEANGHISDRQAEAVRKALARFEAR